MKQRFDLLAGITWLIIHVHQLIVTLCACAQQGLSDRFVSSLSVDTKISSLSTEGLVEGLVQDRIQKIIAST